jgi:hypothetical protein
VLLSDPLSSEPLPVLSVPSSPLIRGLLPSQTECHGLYRYIYVYICKNIRWYMCIYTGKWIIPSNPHPPDPCLLPSNPSPLIPNVSRLLSWPPHSTTWWLMTLKVSWGRDAEPSSERKYTTCTVSYVYICVYIYLYKCICMYVHIFTCMYNKYTHTRMKMTLKLFV